MRNINLTDKKTIDNIIGKTTTEAKTELENNGLTMRITKEDGEYLFVTADSQPNRINVAVENGIVTEVLGVG